MQGDQHRSRSSWPRHAAVNRDIRAPMRSGNEVSISPLAPLLTRGLCATALLSCPPTFQTEGLHGDSVSTQRQPL